MAIIFEGDFVRSTNGEFSRVTNIANWDDNGDADLFLADGAVIHSSNVTMFDVRSEASYTETV